MEEKEIKDILEGNIEEVDVRPLTLEEAIKILSEV